MKNNEAINYTYLCALAAAKAMRDMKEEDRERAIASAGRKVCDIRINFHMNTLERVGLIIDDNCDFDLF